MDSTFRILAVCTGNLHRSALAETMLSLWADWYLPQTLSAQVRVSSAGTAAVVGASMTARVAAIARELGARDTAHTASQITDAEISSADLVLVAARTHRDEVLSRVPSALRRTFTFREAGRIAGRLSDVHVPGTIVALRRVVSSMSEYRFAVSPDDDDVTDPQGLGDDAYARMTREEIPALASLAHVLFGMPRADVDAYRSAVERDDDEDSGSR